MSFKFDVSIIIPVYNVEEWIRECLDSILKQSVDNFEVILIDDGSTDNSGLICDEYSAQYDIINVIHKENEGVSIARNIGIEKSCGKYIAFIDPDDIIHSKYLEEMLKVISSKNTDMIIVNYTNEKKNLESQQNNIYKKEVSSRDIIDKILDGKSYDGYLWNKMFRGDIIRDNEIRFPENISIWEDLYFVIVYLNYIDKCIITNEVLYFYRLRSNGAVNSYNSDKVLSKIKVCELLMNLKYLNRSKINIYLEKIYVNILIEYGYLMIKEDSITKLNISLIMKKIIKYRRAFPINVKSVVKFLIIVNKYIRCNITF